MLSKVIIFFEHETISVGKKFIFINFRIRNPWGKVEWNVSKDF